ncbi:hypothetical protein, partial [Mesorhizobium sp.]|uniref:hypothetical protein n=1 Tax=Mesorhizobium sp. TaxID=1871066 RepID=UPI0025F10634
MPTLSLLPLWEKVDRRVAPRRMRGVGRSAVGAKLEHPSSVAFGDTFSHMEGFARGAKWISVVSEGLFEGRQSGF